MRLAQAARKLVQTAALPPSLTEGVSGLICQLLAEVKLAQGHTKPAIQHFRAARACFLQASNVSPVETAQLLYGFAKARQANGQPQHAALLDSSELPIASVIRSGQPVFEPNVTDEWKRQIATSPEQHGSSR